ncbi:MAG: DUF6020 family protein [Lachnospiraceae bacterium]|nr:DUF6020 family protein [Lachnospiraceae bacterium]
MRGLNTLCTRVLEKHKRPADGTGFAFLKCFLAVWVLSCDSLSLLLSGYSTDTPVLKYVFTVLEAVDGWGVDTLFLALGLGVVFFKVRSMQKNRALSFLCAFFAACTCIGISYSKTNSWDCIFLFGLQFILAVLVWMGYYFAYKNCILFVIYLIRQNGDIFYVNAKSRLGRFLFNRYAFRGAFILLIALGTVWLIAFFPGPMQPDAYVQLLMKYGVFEYTAHFPVAATEVMGFCMNVGKNAFNSDVIGIFIYTFIQYIIQCLVFSYSLFLMNKMKTPIVFRCVAVFVYGVSPLFNIWGYTFVKDSFYYIFFLLMVCSLIDIALSGQKEYAGESGIAIGANIYKTILLTVGCMGICMFRNDGKYVALLSLVSAIFFANKYWKSFLTAAAVCVLSVFLTEGIYMSVNNIPAGSVGEMLSIPLQQTARYITEHPDDITQDELQVLQEGFEVDISQIPSLYNPVLSDTVKAEFVKNSEPGYLKEYFKVWLKQLVRHPDTYIQAFLNQTYAYFYPDAHDGKDEVYQFYIVYGNALHDDCFDIEFGMNNDALRQLLMHYGYLFEKLPVLSMLLSPGFYTYILIGEAVYLISGKKFRGLIGLIPAFLVLLVCIASPVNGSIRYMLPVMASAPVLLAWCYRYE